MIRHIERVGLTHWTIKFTDAHYSSKHRNGPFIEQIVTPYYKRGKERHELLEYNTVNNLGRNDLVNKFVNVLRIY